MSLVCDLFPLVVGVLVASAGRRAGRGAALSAVGTGLTLPFSVLIAFAGAGHCPQGDPETYIIGHLGNSALFWFALPLLVGSAKERHPFRWGVPVFTVVPLLFELPHAYEVVVQGVHLCGVERGDTLLYLNDPFAAWYYQAHWVYAISLSVAALWPWLKPHSSPSEL